jgi:hypothetical protein
MKYTNRRQMGEGIAGHPPELVVKCQSGNIAFPVVYQKVIQHPEGETGLRTFLTCRVYSHLQELNVY